MAGVALLALAAPGAIRGPLDGLAYGALTGLGFQVMENISYSLNNIPLSGATDPAAAVSVSAAIRVGVTGLSSHWAMTAIAGAGVGYLAARGPRRGTGPAAACLAVALALHAQFDAPGPPIAIKVVLNFVTVVFFFLWQWDGFRGRARAALAAAVAAGTVPASEAPTLLTRGRRRYRRRRARAGAERAAVSAHQHADLDGIEAAAADRAPAGHSSRT